MHQTRDDKERLKLWDLYNSERRCCGGHVIHADYCCPWCGSFDPTEKCIKENISPKPPMTVEGAWNFIKGSFEENHGYEGSELDDPSIELYIKRFDQAVGLIDSYIKKPTSRGRASG